MKKHLTTILLVAVFVAGLSLLLYPTVSDYINSLNQSRAIAAYSDKVKKLADKDYRDFLDSARDYNKALNPAAPRTLSESEYDDYYNQLNPSGGGMMGYIEIPKINCTLPVYHGTDESVLEIAIGHIEGTSLPVGGEGTHTVLSGHRGLPSAKLFTNLDELAEGDRFVLRILDETLTYEVDKISIVLPYEISQLEAQKGRDLCTLVTCTPYGINTHRLLVTGHRVENEEAASAVRVTSEASIVNKLIVASVVAVPILILMLIFVLLRTRTKKKKITKGVDNG